MVIVQHGAIKRRRQRPRETEKPENKLARRNLIGVGLMLVVAWAYGFFPNMISNFQNGRGRVVVDNVLPPVPAAQVLLKVLFAAFVLVAVWLLLTNLKRKVAPRNGALFILMLPFLVITIASLANSGKPSLDTVIYPLAVLTLWRVQVPFRALTIVGWVTVIGAAISFAMGVLVPEVGATLPPIIGDKVYWPTLLVGPYAHPNVLGLGISMGIPFVFLIKRRFVRTVGLLIVALDVAWSGNRCSILAMGICLAVFALLSMKKGERKWSGIAAVAGAYLVISTPLTSQAPDDYSYRGQIWAASLDFWRGSPWLGGGPDYYKTAAEYANDMGATAFSGHNALVHLLATGGICMLLAVILLHVVAWQSALKLPALAGRVSLAFIVIAIFNGWLQNTISYTDLTELAYVTWMPLAVMLFAADHKSIADAEIPMMVRRKNVLPVRYARLAARKESLPLGAMPPGPSSSSLG